MGLIIGLLTFVLFLNSAFLMLLILIQLPKKEAGAGLAFGGGTTDALFGAGSGNVLTRITKYATGLFLGLALFLAVLRNHHAKSTAQVIASEIDRKATAAAVSAPPASSATNLVIPAPTVASNVVPAVPALTTTNIAPALTTTNVVPITVEDNNP